MATEVASVYAKIGADTSGLKKGLEDAGGSLAGFGKKLSGIAAAIGAAFAVKKVIGWVSDAVEAANEDVSAMTKLGLAVENTGASFEDAEGKINDFILAQMKSTTYSDGEQMAAIQTLTEITGDYNEALDLTALSADMAAATGMDLASAAKLVGRVSKGDTALLKRYGIVIAEGASATEALAEMQAKYAGQAEAAGRSGAGAAKRLSNAWSEVKDTLVSNLAPGITDIQNQLADFLFDNLPAIQGFADAVGNFIGPAFEKVAGFATTAFDVITKLLSGEMDWSKLGIPQFIVDGFERFKALLGSLGGIFGTALKGLLSGEGIMSVWYDEEPVVDGVTGMLKEGQKGLKSRLTQFGKDIVENISKGLEDIGKALDGMADKFLEWVDGSGKEKAAAWGENLGSNLVLFLKDALNSLITGEVFTTGLGVSMENGFTSAAGKVRLGLGTLFAEALSGSITGALTEIFGDTELIGIITTAIKDMITKAVLAANPLSLLIELFKSSIGGMKTGLGMIQQGFGGGGGGGTYNPYAPSLTPQSYGGGGNNIVINTTNAHGVVLELKRLGAI